MNKFVIALLPLLAAANAGIYSARWPEGEVAAKVILRSGHVGLQGIDSATHNPGYVPQLRTDLVEESSNLNLKTDEEKDLLKPMQEPHTLKENEEGNMSENANNNSNEEKDSLKPTQELNTEQMKQDNAEGERDSDRVDTAQIGLRSDLPEYVNIGSMQNRPPIAWQTWRYQPKRIRSVLIEETDVKPTGIVESPEAPASTAKTPELENLDPKPAAIEKLPEASISTSRPQLDDSAQTADNQKQLRYGYLIPTYNYNRHPIRLNPSYQSATAVAQNAPGINYAASSANSQGLGNGAALSQAVNFGGLQSAVSSANNNQGSAIAAAQNNGRQSSSIAQAFNNRGHVRYIAPQYQSATAFAANHN